MSGNKPDKQVITDNNIGMWNIAKINDLKGTTMLPGLIDVQSHPADAIKTIEQANVDSPPSENDSDI